MNRDIRFRGGRHFLSNFYVCRIHVWDREFTSVESAYQWRKCMHHGDMQTAEKMLSTRTGLQAKYLSKSIREKEQLRAAWDKQRYSLMYALVAVKYRDPTLRKRLLDTGYSQLQEWVKSREGCTDIQWSSRSEHARTYTHASTRVHSIASDSPHSDTMARRNARRSQDR